MQHQPSVTVTVERLTETEALSIPDGEPVENFAAVTLPPVSLVPGAVPGPDGEPLPALQVTVLLPPGLARTSRIGPPYDVRLFGGASVRVIVRREHLLEKVKERLDALDGPPPEAQPSRANLALDLSRFLPES